MKITKITIFTKKIIIFNLILYFFFFSSSSILFIFSNFIEQKYMVVILNNLFGNIFQNIPLIYLFLKIILMYLSSMKLKKINKIEDEEKKKKSKNRFKLVIFLVNITIFSIYVGLMINDVLNALPYI